MSTRSWSPIHTVVRSSRRFGLEHRWLNHRLDRVEARLDVLSA